MRHWIVSLLLIACASLAGLVLADDASAATPQSADCICESVEDDVVGEGSADPVALPPVELSIVVAKRTFDWMLSDHGRYQGTLDKLPKARAPPVPLS